MTLPVEEQDKGEMPIDAHVDPASNAEGSPLKRQHWTSLSNISLAWAMPLRVDPELCQPLAFGFPRGITV